MKRVPLLKTICVVVQLPRRFRKLSRTVGLVCGGVCDLGNELQMYGDAESLGPSHRLEQIEARLDALEKRTSVLEAKSHVVVDGETLPLLASALVSYWRTKALQSGDTINHPATSRVLTPEERPKNFQEVARKNSGAMAEMEVGNAAQ